ncbi:sugar phosphate isomerase/epimerase family protein [Actinophytocola gossypii]|uniref:Sugar phosphate isomerase/epimerase n=1 Tax=Actinophytocola gossypii TaxID=2812003 RepID=A0ABT2JBL3_9PSEU|nr:sugar phosphate isomerase/epimerase [Actinophytocola gossypii]MCT2584830.1 sugar phosphate isomerase/epimerase [Actinophytocola gossypii]
MKTIPATVRAALAAALSVGLILTGTAVSGAAPPENGPGVEERGAGRGVPDSQISIQLYTFAEYIGFGSDEATLDRLRFVLSELAEIGYRNVEPFTFNGLTAERFDALLDGYGLRATSRHGDTNEATWDAELANSRTLGQKFVGSGGSAAPGLWSYEDTLATAATLDRLGSRSVRNGTGKIFVHNHQNEFTTTFTDPTTGRAISAWELLLLNTDHRYVTFQLDVGWAVAAGVDVPRLLEKYGDRIDLLHVKDGTEVDGEFVQAPLGAGEVDLRPILAAAKGKVRYYVFEQDPIFFGEVDTMLDEARTSFRYLDRVTY